MVQYILYMRKWPEDLRLKARQLRSENRSIGEISRLLEVPKTTLYYWITDLKRPAYITREEKLKHLERIREMGRAALKNLRMKRLKNIQERVQKEVRSCPHYNKGILKALLAFLYWAEGTKIRGTLIFTNTDPDLILLYITLLRKCYAIDENKLRARLHLHHYHNPEESLNFWSKLTGIPKSKFGKIYIKPRSKTRKFRENFAGICFIKYYSEDLRYEVLETAYALSRKITSH